MSDTGPPRVDPHSHVLPGLDDGARDDEQALAMLRIAAMDGADMLVATPHADRADRETILRATERLNDQAARDGLRIRVLPGSETRLALDTARHFRAGNIVSINQTDYVLVELPLRGPWPLWAAQALFELRLAGALPVLAHVERYPGVQRDPAVLADLARAGVLLQVNADTFDGRRRGRSGTTVETLLRAGLVHLVASDAHDVHTRPPRLSAAFTRITELVGAEVATRLAGNAARVVMGEAVEAREPDLAPCVRGLGQRLRQFWTN